MPGICITNAGKRNDRIYKEGAPTSDIKGKVGQLYIDVTNNDVYVCTSQGTWLKAISNGEIVAGSEVIANPTPLSGATDLYGLEINGTKYKVKRVEDYFSQDGALLIRDRHGDVEELPIGSAGQVLTVSEMEEPEWAPAPSFSLRKQAFSFFNTGDTMITAMEQVLRFCINQGIADSVVIVTGAISFMNLAQGVMIMSNCTLSSEPEELSWEGINSVDNTSINLLYSVKEESVWSNQGGDVSQSQMTGIITIYY